MNVIPEDQVDPLVKSLITEMVGHFESLTAMIVTASGGDKDYRDMMVSSTITAILRRACGAGVIPDPPAFFKVTQEAIAKDATERLARKFQMS